MTNIVENNGIITILLTAMFIISGLNKFYTFDETVNSLQQKLQYNINLDFYKFVIFIVILLEIMAPLIIINYAFTGKYKKEAYYSTIALIIFTILATLIYHFPNFTNYKKSLGFWANMSLLGGLLLLLKTINLNII
jgi:uncharacterized membrane protein YphA (DoxX/SURF4 family)